MKSTTDRQLDCDALWNERQAHISMQQSVEQVEQDRIADRNAQVRLNEKMRKQNLNKAFIAKLREVLTFIAIALIAYTLYRVWL